VDELGLPAAIEALAERSSTTGGLEIHGDVSVDQQGEGATGRLDPQLESIVYRLVQEALTNVVKHARAERVDIQVTTRDDRVTVEVRDDGVGFDPALNPPGFGLLGMRERLELVGGTLDVSSAPGRGTSVRVELPLSSPTPAG
jgi:signal transduction histidine kinase